MQGKDWELCMCALPAASEHLLSLCVYVLNWFSFTVFVRFLIIEQGDNPIVTIAEFMKQNRYSIYKMNAVTSD